MVVLIQRDVSKIALALSIALPDWTLPGGGCGLCQSARPVLQTPMCMLMLVLLCNRVYGPCQQAPTTCGYGYLTCLTQYWGWLCVGLAF
jgi:hypothetical protein